MEPGFYWCRLKVNRVTGEPGEWRIEEIRELHEGEVQRISVLHEWGPRIDPPGTSPLAESVRLEPAPAKTVCDGPGECNGCQICEPDELRERKSANALVDGIAAVLRKMDGIIRVTHAGSYDALYQSKAMLAQMLLGGSPSEWSGIKGAPAARDSLERLSVDMQEYLGADSNYSDEAVAERAEVWCAWLRSELDAPAPSLPALPPDWEETADGFQSDTSSVWTDDGEFAQFLHGNRAVPISFRVPFAVLRRLLARSRDGEQRSATERRSPDDPTKENSTGPLYEAQPGKTPPSTPEMYQLIAAPSEDLVEHVNEQLYMIDDLGTGDVFLRVTRAGEALARSTFAPRTSETPDRWERLERGAKALPMGKVFDGGGLHDAPQYDVAMAAVRYARGEPSLLGDIANLVGPLPEAPASSLQQEVARLAEDNERLRVALHESRPFVLAACESKHEHMEDAGCDDEQIEEEMSAFLSLLTRIDDVLSTSSNAGEPVPAGLHDAKAALDAWLRMIGYGWFRYHQPDCDAISAFLLRAVGETPATVAPSKTGEAQTDAELVASASLAHAPDGQVDHAGALEAARYALLHYEILRPTHAHALLAGAYLDLRNKHVTREQVETEIAKKSTTPSPVQSGAQGEVYTMATREPPILETTAANLLAAAQSHWSAFQQENRPAAVVWTSSTSGELIVYTRGEYKEAILHNVDDVNAPVVEFDASQESDVSTSPLDEVAFDAMEQAMRTDKKLWARHMRVKHVISRYMEQHAPAREEIEREIAAECIVRSNAMRSNALHWEGRDSEKYTRFMGAHQAVRDAAGWIAASEYNRGPREAIALPKGWERTPQTDDDGDPCTVYVRSNGENLCDTVILVYENGTIHVDDPHEDLTVREVLTVITHHTDQAKKTS